MRGIELLKAKIKESRVTCREEAYVVLCEFLNRPDLKVLFHDFALTMSSTPVGCKSHPLSRRLGNGQCFACYQQRWTRFRAQFNSDPIAKSIRKAVRESMRVIRNARQRITQREARLRDPERFYATESRRRGSPKRKASIRKAHLARKYGMTPECYDRLFKKQKYKCAICRTPTPVQKFHIDHCHASGKVRGILCNSCNVGIGFFYHNTKLLTKAITYLQKHANT